MRVQAAGRDCKGVSMEPAKSDLIENRQIRVFISSTFRDMQAERDHLVTKVFPALRRYCEERDVSFFELDLRWGISEEESKQGKVVDICLKEIQKTRPFFIGLLGERYGWTPSEEERQAIASNTKVFEEYPWINAELDKGTSTTEIEIQEGVLKANEKPNAYFYFRSPKMKTPPGPDFSEQDGSREEQKLRSLKTVLRNQNEYPIQDYDSVEHLGDLVEKDFKALVDRLFPSGALSPLEKQRLEQRTYLKNRTGVYIPVPGLFEKLDDFVEGDGRFLVIGGGPGMGKSALLANWMSGRSSRFSGESSAEKIIYHGIGVSGSGADYRRITGRLINEVRDLYGLEAPLEGSSGDIGSAGSNESPDKQKETLQNLLFEVADRGRLIIVLDGMDKLLDIDNAKGLGWFPALPQNVRVIFSARQNDTVMDSFKRREYPVITVEPLSVENRKRLAVEYLKTFGKGLVAVQLDRIACDAESENPLALRSLLDELRVFGVYEQLDAEIDRYLAAPDIESFFALVLERLEKLFDDDGQGGTNFAAETFALLEVSRAGLSETEILGITGAKPFYWSQLYSALSGHVQSQNGLVSFAHDFIRNAVRQRYLSQPEVERDFRIRIVSRMETSDAVSQNRKYDETPYQLFALKDWDKLYTFLMDLDVFEYINDKDEYELGTYWRALREADAEKYSLGKYLELDGGERDEEELASVYNNIGITIADTLGDYPQALEYFRKALAVWEEALGTKHPNTASSYSNIGFIYEKMGDYPKALEYSLKALAIQEEALGTKHPNTAMSYNNIGALYNGMGDYPKALEYYRKALAVWEEALGTNHPDTAASYNSIGDAYSSTADYPQALEYFRKALAIREELLGTNHPDTAESYNNIGLLYSKMRDYPKALEYSLKALATWKEMLGTNHPNTAMSYNNIGTIYYSMGDYPQALEYFLNALAIQEEMLGINHSDTAQSYNNIGAFYNGMRDYPQALEYSLKALAIREKALGTNHPDTAESYNNTSGLYSDMGDYPQALEYSLKALAIREEVLGTKHPGTATSYNNIGDTYGKMRDYPQALEYYRKALAIQEETIGTKHPDTAISYNNIGDAYKNMRGYPQALEYHRKALTIREETLGIKHSDTAESYNKIGLIYCRRLDDPQALEYFLKASAIREEVLGMNHPDTAVSYDNIGMLYSDMGDYPQALEYSLKALAIWEKVLGTKDVDIATSYSNIGDTYSHMRDYPHTLEFYQKVLAIREEALGTKHPDTAVSYNNIGDTYSNMGDYQRALEYHHKALAIREETLGTKHPNTVESYDNIGVLYSNMGDYPHALEYYLKALAIAEEVGADYLGIDMSYNSIGVLYSNMDDYPHALEYYFKALATREKVLGTNHLRTAESYRNIGDTYGKLGDYPQALNHYQQALEIYLALGDEKGANTVRKRIDRLTSTQQGVPQ
jgi:tetratricopeptide (TPR) repeat protein